MLEYGTVKIKDNSLVITQFKLDDKGTDQHSIFDTQPKFIWLWHNQLPYDIDTSIKLIMINTAGLI